MPDRGMWNMKKETLWKASYTPNFLPYSTDVEEWKGVLYKRCSGHRGEWHPECNKDYPDRMVPFSGFGMDSSSKDGLHHRCLKCDRMRVADEQRHPITN